MNVLTLSGSARNNSLNIKLLKAIPAHFPEHKFNFYSDLHLLPLFHADLQGHIDSDEITKWKTALKFADVIIISTPAYIMNVPAILKNALEWVTDSGELVDMRILVITFTPYKPRGEKTMKSLLWSLQALKSNIVAQLPLFQNEIVFNDKGAFIENKYLEILKGGVRYLITDNL